MQLYLFKKEMRSPVGKFLEFLYQKRKKFIHREEFINYLSGMEKEVYDEFINELFRGLFKYEEIYDAFADDLTSSDIEPETMKMFYEFEILTESLAGHSIKIIFKDFLNTLKSISDNFEVTGRGRYIEVFGELQIDLLLPKEIVHDFFDSLTKYPYLKSKRRPHYFDFDDNEGDDEWWAYREEPDVL